MNHPADWVGLVLRAFAIPERDVGVPRAGRGVHFHVQPISSGHTEDSWDLQGQESPTTSPFFSWLPRLVVCLFGFCARCVCIVLRGALVQLCCTIAFVKFDTHRAGPRWTGGGTPTVREFLRPRKFPRNTTSVGWFVPTQNIFAGECLRRFSPPQNLCLGGQGSGRAGNRRRQNTRTPHPLGGWG